MKMRLLSIEDYGGTVELTIAYRKWWMLRWRRTTLVQVKREKEREFQREFAPNERFFYIDLACGRDWFTYSQDSRLTALYDAQCRKDQHFCKLLSA